MGGWLGRVVAAVALAAVLVVTGTAFAVWKQARVDQRAPSDAILVLGSAQYNGVPSSVFEARLAHALDLYRHRGVPADAIVPVKTGTDTLTSMQAVRLVYANRHWNRIIVVTDPWHELRSNRIAADLQMATLSSPTRQGPAVYSRQTQIKAIIRETAAYLVYRLTGATPETRIG